MANAELEGGAKYVVDNALLEDYISSEEVDKLRRLRQKELAAAVAALGITKRKPSAQEIRTSISLNAADLTPEKIDLLARVFGDGIREAFSAGDEVATEGAVAPMSDAAEPEPDSEGAGDLSKEEFGAVGQVEAAPTTLEVPEQIPATVSVEGKRALRRRINPLDKDAEEIEDPAELVALAARKVMTNDDLADSLRGILTPQYPTPVIEQAISSLEGGGAFDDEAQYAVEWLQELLKERGADVPATDTAPEAVESDAGTAAEDLAEGTLAEEPAPSEATAAAEAAAATEEPVAEPSPEPVVDEAAAPETEAFLFSEADLPQPGDPVTARLNRGGMQTVPGEFVFREYRPDREEIILEQIGNPHNTVPQKTGMFLYNNPQYQAEIKGPLGGRAPAVGETVRLKRLEHPDDTEGEEWTVAAYTGWKKELRRWISPSIKLVSSRGAELFFSPQKLAKRLVGAPAEAVAVAPATSEDDLDIPEYLRGGSGPDSASADAGDPSSLTEGDYSLGQEVKLKSPSGEVEEGWVVIGRTSDGSYRLQKMTEDGNYLVKVVSEDHLRELNSPADSGGASPDGSSEEPSADTAGEAGSGEPAISPPADGGGEPPVPPPVTAEAEGGESGEELRRQLKEIADHHGTEIGQLPAEVQQWIQDTLTGELSPERLTALGAASLALHELRQQIAPFADLSELMNEGPVEALDLALSALVDLNHRFDGPFVGLMTEVATALQAGPAALEALANDPDKAEQRSKLRHVMWRIDQLAVEELLAVEQQAQLRNLLEKCGLIEVGGELIPQEKWHEALWSKRAEIMASDELIALLDEVAEGAAAERDTHTRRSRREREAVTQPPLERMTKEDFDTRAPVYFKRGLLGLFGDDEALLGRYLDADPNTEEGQAARLQIIGDLALAQLSDEQKQMIEGMSPEQIESSGVIEGLEEYGRVIDTLLEDAVNKFENKATADRLIEISRFGQRLWQVVRKLGLNSWVAQGGFFKRFFKGTGLGVVSGMLLRAGVGKAASEKGTEAASEAAKVAAGEVAGRVMGIVGAAATMNSFTNLAFSRIESNWMNPPRGARPRGGVKKWFRKVFHGEGENLSEYDYSWIDELEPQEALQRVVEARLYLTRRERVKDESRSPAERDVHDHEMKMYRRLLDCAVGQMGSVALAAALAEADAAAAAEAAPASAAPETEEEGGEPTAIDSIPVELTQGLTLTLQVLAPNGTARRSRYTGELSNPPIEVGKEIRLGIRNFRDPVKGIVQAGQVYTINLKSGTAFQLNLAEAAEGAEAQTATEPSETPDAVTAEDVQWKLERTTAGRQLGRALLWGAAGTATSLVVGGYLSRWAGEHIFGGHRHQAPEGQSEQPAVTDDHVRSGDTTAPATDSTGTAPASSTEGAGGPPPPPELPTDQRPAAPAQAEAPAQSGAPAGTPETTPHAGGGAEQASPGAPAAETATDAAQPAVPDSSTSATPGETEAALPGERWIITNEHFRLPEGGHEMMTLEDPAITADDVSREAKEWLGGAEHPAVEANYAEHLVRANLAEKLGLWQDHHDGTGNIVWDKEHVWTKQWDPETQKFYLRLDSPMQTPGMANIPAGTITIRDGAFDFGELKPTMVSPAMVEQFNSGWAPFAEIRAEQIYNSINTDLPTLARYTGVPVETLQAQPALADHLRDTARQIIRSQSGVTENGKPVELPKVEGWAPIRPAHTLEIKGARFLGAPLRQEAENWADENGVQLLPPRSPSNPLQNWSGRGTGATGRGAGAGAGNANSGGYAGWGGGRAGSVANNAAPTGMPSRGGETLSNGANGVQGISGAAPAVADKIVPTHLLRPAPLPGEEGVEMVSSTGPQGIELGGHSTADSAQTIGGETSPSATGGSEFSTTSVDSGSDGATQTPDANNTSGASGASGIRSHSERLGPADDQAHLRTGTGDNRGPRVEVREPSPVREPAETNTAPQASGPAGGEPQVGNRVEIKESQPTRPTGGDSTGGPRQSALDRRPESVLRNRERLDAQQAPTVTTQGDTTTVRNEGQVGGVGEEGE